MRFRTTLFLGGKTATGFEVPEALVERLGQVTVPDDLSAALRPYADVRKYFDSLSYTNRKEIVRGIKDAKTDATRQRRLEKVVSMLRTGKK